MSTRPTTMQFGWIGWHVCICPHVLGQDSVESERPLKVCAEAWAFQFGMQNWILGFVGRLAGNVCGISTNILCCLQSCGHSLQTMRILATLVQTHCIKTLIWYVPGQHWISLVIAAVNTTTGANAWGYFWFWSVLLCMLVYFGNILTTLYRLMFSQKKNWISGTGHLVD